MILVLFGSIGLKLTFMGRPSITNEDKVLEKIKTDLNTEFPFSALWQDGEQSTGIFKYVPVFNLLILIIILIINIVVITKK